MAIKFDQALTTNSGNPVASGAILSPTVTFDRPQYVEGDDPIRTLIFGLPVCKDTTTFKADKDKIFVEGIQEIGQDVFVKKLTPAEYALLSDDTVDTLLQVETWLKDWLTNDKGLTCSIIDPFA